MDLLQTVRKEGSRGGVNFSWDDVKSSSHRENYLGHSLMAPVGRWQKNKDLGWYAKAEDAELTPEERAEREQERKRDEMRKIKEAEEDAMARALGLPVPDRTNANNEPLGEAKISQKEVTKALKEALDDGNENEERSVVIGRHGPTREENEKEIMRGSRQREERRDRSRSPARRKRQDEGKSSKRRHHSKSRSGDRDRDRERRHRHRRHHSRSRSRERKHRSRSRDGHRQERSRRDRDERDRSRDRNRKRDQSRSRSPYEDRRQRRETR